MSGALECVAPMQDDVRDIVMLNDMRVYIYKYMFIYMYIYMYHFIRDYKLGKNFLHLQSPLPAALTCIQTANVSDLPIQFVPLP